MLASLWLAFNLEAKQPLIGPIMDASQLWPPNWKLGNLLLHSLASLRFVSILNNVMSWENFLSYKTKIICVCLCAQQVYVVVHFCFNTGPQLFVPWCFIYKCFSCLHTDLFLGLSRLLPVCLRPAPVFCRQDVSYPSHRSPENLLCLFSLLKSGVSIQEFCLDRL